MKNSFLETVGAVFVGIIAICLSILAFLWHIGYILVPVAVLIFLFG